MCYSAEVSFLTWGFGMACAALLVATGHPVKSFVFPLTVAQMQLIEGLRWMEAIDERILSILGKLAIYAQPVAVMVEGKMTQWIVPYVVAQGVLEALFGSRDLRFVVADDGHFQWRWIHDNWEIATLPYWIAMLITTYWRFPLPVFLAGWSILVYFMLRHWEYKTSGSLWCVWSNLWWLYYIPTK